MRRGLGFHARHSPGGFNPATLFTGGIQGAWYDPSDLTTLFQDSAGTTPVTAVEQPVGLMLDKSKGLVLGPELVTNGDFSQGSTGWTVGTDWSISSGQASHVAGASLSNLFIATPLFVSGLTYQLTIDIVSISGGNLTVFCGDASSITFNTPGTKTMRLRAAGDLRLYIQAAAATVVTVDNISAKLLPGNHAFQSTSASRPTLRARYNLLTYSQDLSNAVWTTTLGTTKDSATTLTIGTGATAEVRQIITPAGGTASRSFTASVTISVASGTALFRIKNTHGSVVDNFSANFTATTTPTTFSFTVNNSASAGDGTQILGIVNASDASSNGKQFILHGAQLTQPAVFPTNVYQRIGAATDYATGAAFPPYLFFDGVDDSMLTNSVDFSGTDKMLVVAGVTKQSDAAAGIVAELSANGDSNNGAFYVSAAAGAASNYATAMRGTSLGYYLPATFAAPITNVVSMIGDIAQSTLATEIVPRINGTVVQTGGVGGSGTGNFGNYPLYIGRRNNASLPLNGNLYSLIIAGQSYAAGQITSTEQWVAARTPLGSI